MAQKFNPELASEMEWSECVLSAALKDDEFPGYTTWVCVSCGNELLLRNFEYLTDTAQAYLDEGWRYRRTRTGLDAVCSTCLKR